MACLHLKDGKKVPVSYRKKEEFLDSFLSAQIEC